MKVLHIWNTAGVGGVIAKYMDKYHDTESKVFWRSCFDPYKLSTEKVTNVKGRAINFYVKIFLQTFDTDIIHIHSMAKIIPYIRLFRPKTPIIMHYHGERREKWGERRSFWRKADKILVSTKDLLDGSPKGTIYQPNPIDIELISSKNNKSPVAFFTSVEKGKADDLAESYAKLHDVPLIIHSRDKAPLPHDKYLEVISSYEYFIDVRRTTDKQDVYKVFSLGGLEALASRCKVIDWNGEIHEGLPPEHYPNQVVSDLFNIYRGVLGC
jgi:hypothetical protein